MNQLTLFPIFCAGVGAAIDSSFISVGAAVGAIMVVFKLTRTLTKYEIQIRENTRTIREHEDRIRSIEAVCHPAKIERQCEAGDSDPESFGPHS